MKKALHIAVTILSLFLARSLNAQDPSFSQFFSSPLNINPALTANINADWRLISNFQGSMDRTCQPIRNRNGVL